MAIKIVAVYGATGRQGNGVVKALMKKGYCIFTIMS
jgi:uncharacterized protein YbjT (DUF2867 family)